MSQSLVWWNVLSKRVKNNVVESYSQNSYGERERV